MVAAVETVKHRALMMGVQTGEMPDVDLIWSVQTADGHGRCFGQAADCWDTGCHWRPQCLALDEYAGACSAWFQRPAHTPERETTNRLSSTSVVRDSARRDYLSDRPTASSSSRSIR